MRAKYAKAHVSVGRVTIIEQAPPEPEPHPTQQPVQERVLYPRDTYRPAERPRVPVYFGDGFFADMPAPRTSSQDLFNALGEFFSWLFGKG